MTRGLILGLICAVLLAVPAHAVPFKQTQAAPVIDLGTPAPKQEPVVAPIVPVAPQPPMVSGRDQELVDIKMLKQRPAGVGGILPFRISDVRNQIDPETRSVTPTPAPGAPTPPPAPTALVTCADGTRFPAAGFAPSIDLVFPASGNGACSMAAGPSALNGVLQVDSFTSVSAAVTGLNGWVANITTLIPGLGAGIATPNVQITKGGVTYRMTLTVQTSGAGGGSVIISSFVKL